MPLSVNLYLLAAIMAGFLPVAYTEMKNTINDQLEWLYSNGVCAYETELPDGRKPILLYVAALWGGDSFYELESLGLGNIVKLDIILNLKRNLARPGFEPGTVRSEVDRANHYSIAAWWIHGQIVINVKRLSFFFIRAIYYLYKFLRFEAALAFEDVMAASVSILRGQIINGSLIARGIFF